MFGIWYFFLKVCLFKNFASNAKYIDLSFLQVITIWLINLSLSHDSSFLMCTSKISLSSSLLSAEMEIAEPYALLIVLVSAVRENGYS